MGRDSAAGRTKGLRAEAFVGRDDDEGAKAMKFDFGKVKNYVGGEWVESSGRESFDVTNPATLEKLGSVPVGTAADVEAAVQAAKKAFTTWREVPVAARARY